MRIASLFLIGLSASLISFRHSDAAVIAYHDATFSNFAGNSGGGFFERTFDVNVDGIKRADGFLRADNFSGANPNFNGNLFSAGQQTPAGVGGDPLLRLTLVENETGNSPALGADVSLSFSNFAPGYESVGLSLSSNGAIWGVNRLNDITFTGASATIFDNGPLLPDNFVVGFGPVAGPFTNGNDLNFASVNFDNANGFLSGTHSFNWGLDIVAGTALDFRYLTAGSVTNVQSEILVFGLELVFVPPAVPELSTFPLAMLGLFSLGLVRVGRHRDVIDR